MQQQKGFTLIELIVVIVILGILAATALPKFVDLSTDARVASMKALEGSMRAASAMVYAKAQVSNAMTGITGTPVSVTVNGVSVMTAYGYPSSITELVKVMDIGSDFTPVAASNYIYSNGAPVTTTCNVLYTPATSLTLPPQFGPSPFGATAYTGC